MIQVQNLGYSYPLENGDRVRALEEINLEIQPGEFVAIIGCNGSGKSTLARLLNGLLKPTTGQVLVDGLDTRCPEQLWDIRRRVGMIFQNPDNQLVSTTVEREIAFGLENLGLPSATIRSRLEETLERLALTRYRNHPPHLLSGGEKQRLAIGAVLAMEPRYLVLDEPTALLDPASRRQVLNLIQTLHQKGLITPIYITQFPEEAAVAPRLLLMHNGRLVDDGPPVEVFRQGSRLQSYGLEAPVAVRLADMLRQRGIDLPPSILTQEDLATALGRLQTEQAKGTGKTGTACPATSIHRLKPPPLQSIPSTVAPEVMVCDLYYVYHAGLPTQTQALAGINLQLRHGELVALVGPSGSGKSTLVQHFNGLLQTQKGSVVVEGIDLARTNRVPWTEIRQQVGLLFQFPEAQLFAETVYDDVAFGPRNLGLSARTVDEQVHRAMDLVQLDLARLGMRSPFTLSGGEKRRVAIAGVLAMAPRILILDEPTAGLDPQGLRQMVEILQQMQGAGVTVLMISHNMDLVGTIAQRVVVMQDGRIVLDGDPLEVFFQRKPVDEIGLESPQLAQILIRLNRQKPFTPSLHFLTLQAVAEEIDRWLAEEAE